LRILVTGGAGYIGSVVVAELVRAGHNVTVYDNLSRGHRGAVHAEAQLAVADLSDTKTLDRCLTENKIEAVMHFAASIEAGESMKFPEQFFRNNTANTLGLLEAMLRAGVRSIVFSSTAALYGEPERTPIKETDTLRPTNAYGESKLLAERMLEWLNRIHGLRYASLRYFNAAGATPELGEAHDPETHLIPLVLQVAAGKRESISIFGADYPTVDGSCVRDYIHVLDLAKAHVLALNAIQTRDKLVYNIGNGAGFSVRQVVEAARRVTGHPIPIIEAPRRSGDPAVLVASSDKIRNELGWHPTFADPETIISDAWDWHRRNPNGYSK
jgi:UDP-glucose 4-epimerase